MQLTPKTIKKFNEGEFNTRIFNGNFAVAELEVFNNRTRYTLRYELSHPSLECFSGPKDKAEFIVWTGCNGIFETVPEELASTVARAKESAQNLLNKKAAELVADMRVAVRGFHEAFCLPC